MQEIKTYLHRHKKHTEYCTWDKKLIENCKRKHKSHIKENPLESQFLN